MAHPLPDFHLPNSNLSSDMLFFYSFGEYMCEVLPAAANRKVIELGPLPPNHIRLNTLLKHTPQFASTFDCPAGSPMVTPGSARCVSWPEEKSKPIDSLDAFAQATI
ncbi:neprilysin-1-like [Haemaphysalis longicornis]